MADVLLEARAVSKRFPLRGGMRRRPSAAVQAVDRVSLTLARGERLGLVGESGSGKTTLAKLLIGLLEPSEGDILVQGQPLRSLRGEAMRAARRTTQFIFQDPTASLDPRMTVEELVGEPLEIHRLARGAARRLRVAELLASVQLPASHAGRLPRQLSGGERQRVGIARALALEPEALICDEPIASLDVSVGAQILELLRRLCAKRRMALLFISHDLRAVAFLCQQIAVMRDGCLLEQAPTARILAAPAHPYTRLLLRCADLDLDANGV